ncbi:DNA mismatch repair endonuclease MutL [Streptobacillus felis]|uniref:DNA mismatch repair protein MutL n=1 Tax=Streptobacillus felis TaxID=1384509 RepID=A0A7Z0PEV6_9FUSO|nr:DNA mismatch repair endonuclease MutL [Streptobacillus felis]NYV27984.1 DNA mismatch repair endonuclease MutL [Streptobacillus felis]
MALIKILDDSISNIIAAGEVVENPASMIKELLENSLDAESTLIQIEVLNGGSYVKISDNGKGMSKEDVLLSIERHATSKISSKEDIFNLRTYGFRGEALASIAAVSKLSMSSKTKDDKLGTIINAYGGVVRKYENFSRTTGTEIEIRDLFYNTPARKKFLRKESTEYGKIKDIVLKEALANPNVSINLFIDGKQTLKTTGNGIESTIFELFGKNVLKNLEKFEYGYLGNVEILRSSKEYIFTYVNGRYVKSNLLDRAVIDAYYTKLMKGKYPFVILMYNVNPKEIDVNVHPSKKIIKFSDEKIVYNDVKKTIEDFFYEFDRKSWQPTLKPKVENKVEEVEKSEYIPINIFSKEELGVKPLQVKETKLLYENPFYEEEIVEKKIVEDKKIENKVEYMKPFFEKKEGEEKHYEILGQIFNTYILVNRDDNLEIYDQHIIHERLLYEELMSSFEKKDISSQILLLPEVVDISPVDKDTIFNNIEIFERLGFEIDEISNNQIALRAVPNFNFRESITNIFENILNDLKNNNKVGDIREKIIISMSCKGAIKAGQRLNMQEMQNMVRRLHEVGKYTCPHGRPIISKISKYDLDKMFGRVK